MGRVHWPGPGHALLELLWYGAFGDRKPWAVQEVMLKLIGKQAAEGRQPPKQHGLVQMVWDLSRIKILISQSNQSIRIKKGCITTTLKKIALRWYSLHKYIFRHERKMHLMVSAIASSRSGV